MYIFAHPSIYLYHSSHNMSYHLARKMRNQTPKPMIAHSIAHFFVPPFHL